MRDKYTIIRLILTECQGPDAYKWAMCRSLETDFKTLSGHLAWLVQHGHVEPYKSVNMCYTLTMKGRDLLRALEKVEELMA